MRTSEYYAVGIRGFFVGWGLDALDRSDNTSVATVERREAVREAAGANYDGYAEDFGHCTGCSCAVYAPCWHCEHDHEDVGCEASV